MVDSKEYKSLDEIKEGKEEKKERKKKEKEEKKREKEERKFMKEIEKEREKMIEREEEEERERKKPIAVYYVHYIGGHPKYPTEVWTEVCLFEEYLMYGHQRVPYKNIKRIGNLTDEHITGKRVFLTGPLIGSLWKKRFLYTVLDYVDNETGEEISLITDFHGKVDQAQAKIYDNMMAARDGKK